MSSASSTSVSSSYALSLPSRSHHPSLPPLPAQVNDEGEYWHASWLDGADGMIQAQVNEDELAKEVLRQAE